jgi:hypothetical protein
MKKKLAYLFVLLVAISSAFAQTPPGLPGLSLHGSGNFLFVPYLNQKGDSTSGTNEYAYLTLNIAAATESYGMAANIGVSTDSAGNSVLSNKIFFPAGASNVIVSNSSFGASVWVKPFDWLKFQAGYFGDYTLSGKLLFSPYWFHSYVTDFLHYNDVFTAFGEEQNFTMSLTPIEGLFIAASLPVNYIGMFGLPSPDSSDPFAEDNYKLIQVGAGYEIKDFGHIRAQYRGETGSYTVYTLDPVTTQEAGAIEAAFAFTKIKGLIIDIGAKIPLSDNARMNVKGDVGIGAAVSYGIGQFSINSLLYFASGYDIDGVKVDPSFTINPWITYAINDSWNVGADANIHTENGVVVVGADTTKGGASFAVFVERSVGFLSNCRLSVAYDTVAERFSIPLMLNVMF